MKRAAEQAADVAEAWHPAAEIPEPDRPRCWSWLVDPGSLTARVRAIDAAAPFSFQVVNEAVESLSVEEAGLLEVTVNSRATVREVVLGRGASPVVFARSVIPESTAVESNRWLLDLGDTPLGDALFENNDVERSEFEVARLEPGCSLHRRICAAVGDTASQVWARRSRIHVNRLPLLVSECFLELP